MSDEVKKIDMTDVLNLVKFSGQQVVIPENMKPEEAVQALNEYQ